MPLSNPIDRLYRLVVGDRVLGALLVLLALSVAAGILLPQAPSSLAPSDTTARWLAETSSRYGSLGGVLQSAGLFDVWHSDWFRGLVAVTAFVLLLRLGLAIGDAVKRLRNLDPVAAVREARRWPLHATIELDAESASVVAELSEVLLSEGWQIAHTGDVFEYRLDEGRRDGMAPWRDTPYSIGWRDADGQGRDDWDTAPADPSLDAAIWPQELRRNEYLRRQGNAFDRPSGEQEAGGDFFSLKEFVTDYQEQSEERGLHHPVRTSLIRAYQYLIAKYDVDGYRIDTLKYIEPAFAQTFGNAIREYALSLGKKNFFTFGEVYDSEEKLSLIHI